MVRAIFRGVAAGAAGTAAMTAWQELAARLRSSGADEGRDGPSDGGDPWAQAPAPAQAAKKIGEDVLGVRVPASAIGLLTNAMHWAYGTGWGAAYGLLTGRRPRGGPLRRGVAFGAAVWAASYAQLVPMGIYEPPWAYPPRELALDLSYHLAYGMGAAGAYALLTPATRRSRP